MNEHDLFRAIGHADDAFLLEIAKPKPRRLPKQFGLITAVLALVLTACAAPVVIRSFDKVQGGNIVTSGQDMELTTIIRKDGTTVETRPIYTSGTVSLEVTPAEDAPETIEEAYFPLKLLDHCTIESYTEEETVISAELSMNAPKHMTVHDILYQQHVLPKDGKIEVEGIVGTGPWTQEEKTYGNISTIQFSGKWSLYCTDRETGELITGWETPNSTIFHIFWSDGMYLYCVKLPIIGSITASAIEEILTSLTAVEDITPYLPAAE